MEVYSHKPTEVNAKDLLFFLLRKVGIVILAGIIVGAALLGYKVLRSNDVENILDITNPLDGESDVAYQERVSNVNRAKDLISSIDALNVQTENYRNYTTNSILMQIDSENEAVSVANLVVVLSDSSTVGMDQAIASAYVQDVLTGDYLLPLAQELGTEQGYLVELITADLDKGTNVAVNTSDEVGSAASVTIRVIGSSVDLTDRILDAVLNEMDAKCIELNEFVASHSIVVSGRQSSYMVDSKTRDLQYSAANRFETIQKQISLYDGALEEVATRLGIGSKENLYAYYSYNDDSWSKTSVISNLKYAIVGFIFGSFLALLVFVLKYVFGKRFETQSKFFSHFPSVKKIGVVKPSPKRSSYVRMLDKKTGDDDGLDLETSYKLMAANLKNLTGGMKNVMVTGTAEISSIKALVDNLGIHADVKESIFVDPSVLETVSGYDGLIVVEQRRHSDMSLVAEELRLIANTDIRLVGVIVI